MNILIVYTNSVWPMRSTIGAHLAAMEQYPGARCVYWNTARGSVPRRVLSLPLDLIVFHTTFLSERWRAPLFEAARTSVRALRDRVDAPKVALPQDEFIHTDTVCEFVNDFGVDVVMSLAPPTEWRRIYSGVDHSRVRFGPTLAGYVDQALVSRIDRLAMEHRERDIDLGYRAWHAAPWLGRHGQLKVEVARRFEGVDPTLVVDVSTRESDVLVGDDWFRFLLRCRAVLGVEGGSSILDRDGSIKRCSDDYLARHPLAPFEDVEAACFAGFDGSFDYRMLTPRNFEAAVTRTCQVLVEGRYNGVLSADDHYIAVRDDFSNIDEVVERLHDRDATEAIAERAHQDMVHSGEWTYARLARDVVEAAFPSSRPEGTGLPTSIRLSRAQLAAGERWSKRFLAARWAVARGLSRSLTRRGVRVRPEELFLTRRRARAIVQRLSGTSRPRVGQETVVSITPIAVERDTRTFKQAATYARLGYRSIVVEGARSDVDDSTLPFERRSVAKRIVQSQKTGRRRRGLRALGQIEARLTAPLRVLPPAALYHLHEFSLFPAAWVAKRRHGAKLLYDAHDFYPAELEGVRTPLVVRIGPLLERACIRGSDAMTTVSDRVADLYEDRFGIRPIVVRNLHDRSLDRDPAVGLRELVGASADDLVLVTIGQRKPGMAVESALRALKELPESVHWVWIGPGYEDDVVAESDVDVAERAHFIGWQPPSQIVPLAAGGDVAVVLYVPLNSNLAAALPNGFFQSVAAGLPLLYPRLPELERAIAGRDVGREIDPLDPSTIVDAVVSMLDPQARRECGQVVSRLSETLTWPFDEGVLRGVLATLLRTGERAG